MKYKINIIYLKAVKTIRTARQTILKLLEGGEENVMI